MKSFAMLVRSFHLDHAASLPYVTEKVSASVHRNFLTKSIACLVARNRHQGGAAWGHLNPANPSVLWASTVVSGRCKRHLILVAERRRGNFLTPTVPAGLAQTAFKGKVYMTHATKAIYKLLLLDFVRVSKVAVEDMLYDEHDLERSMAKIEVSGLFPPSCPAHFWALSSNRSNRTR